MLILQSLAPPPNYKIVLEMDQQTEKLVLKILKREAFAIRFPGLKVFRYVQNWTHPEAEQRRIEGRTYETLLQQLQAFPEFLEFELEVSGSLVYREV
jgi:hypothetical protein